MLICGVELETPVGHIGDLPTTHAVVHANLSCVLVAFSWADDADHLSGAPSIVVGLVLFIVVVICLGLDHKQVIGPKALLGVECASKSAGRSRRQEREGNNLVGWLWALRRNDLM